MARSYTTIVIFVLDELKKNKSRRLKLSELETRITRNWLVSFKQSPEEELQKDSSRKGLFAHQSGEL